MRTDPGERPGILVALDVLVLEDRESPRPLDSAATALDRLAWVGRPAVLAGHELFGRRLPQAEDDRVAWVRGTFGQDSLDVYPFDEPEADRAGEAAHAIERWTEARERWQATWLLTSRVTSVGAARRADLQIVRIGPRGADATAAVERADYEARDLLDAVSHLLTRDAFSAGRSG